MKLRDTGRNNVNLFSRRNNHVPLFTVLKNNNTMSMLQSILRSACTACGVLEVSASNRSASLSPYNLLPCSKLNTLHVWETEGARRDVTTGNSLGNADRSGRW